jgi:hypothetical protein
MPAWPGFGPDQDDSTVHPASRGQLRMAITSSRGTGELRSCVAQQWGAKMRARGTGGGGGVVAQRLAVMAKAWCRPARGSLSTGKQTDAEGKADDGPSRLVRLSVGDDESALPESTGPTGKRSAVKVARSVWGRGKAARPYLLPQLDR